MFRIFKKSWQTGIVTTGYPNKTNNPVEGFRGLPICQENKCQKCGQCAEICPTKAITLESASFWSVDPKKCIFCGYCADACDNNAITQSTNFELATPGPNQQNNILPGRSMHIRHLDAGSCNGCEWEMATLTGPVYDIQRLGFDFVASPRHADILMVTGPVTRNLETAVNKTYNATPAPKLVIAVGTCACSGGLCGQNHTSTGGVDNILPVDIYIPGCPPRPQALIHGLLSAVGKNKKDS